MLPLEPLDRISYDMWSARWTFPLLDKVFDRTMLFPPNNHVEAYIGLHYMSGSCVIARLLQAFTTLHWTSHLYFTTPEITLSQSNAPSPLRLLQACLSWASRGKCPTIVGHLSMLKGSPWFLQGLIPKFTSLHFADGISTSMSVFFVFVV